MTLTPEALREVMRKSFPLFMSRVEGLSSLNLVLEGGAAALNTGGISWAVLNQILHRASEAGMSEGFFKYYFHDVPDTHPYPVNLVLGPTPYSPTAKPNMISSLEQLRWGFTRFVFDAMLYWGNFRQAYRDLRELSVEALTALFKQRRIDEAFLGSPAVPVG